ncbi:MAG: hypothetical protein IMZ62_18375, partial [Chloroflexi bacterium]|nr:hypothetical protein [Chloroflexota bacterium]
MARRQPVVSLTDCPVARRILWAFALLAFGDNGYVGFQVIAYAMGGLEGNPVLVGLGALSNDYNSIKVERIAAISFV